mmetsp:Transcript_47979/g.97687  ORF Transcript_47979/g.97687 Transcript_47979/m.97687 type:complete len:233 (+) Transcript_47979:1235-1933(+)
MKNASPSMFAAVNHLKCSAVHATTAQCSTKELREGEVLIEIFQFIASTTLPRKGHVIREGRLVAVKSCTVEANTLGPVVLQDFDLQKSPRQRHVQRHLRHGMWRTGHLASHAQVCWRFWRVHIGDVVENLSFEQAVQVFAGADQNLPDRFVAGIVPQSKLGHGKPLFKIEDEPGIRTEDHIVVGLAGLTNIETIVWPHIQWQDGRVGAMPMSIVAIQRSLIITAPAEVTPAV